MTVKERYEAYLRACAGRPGLWEVNGETRERQRLTAQGGTYRQASVDHQTVLYARAGETSVGYAVTQCLEDEPEKLLEEAAENGRLTGQAGMEPCQEARVSGEEKQRLSNPVMIADLARQGMKRLPEAELTIEEQIRGQWVVNQKGLNRQSSRRHFAVQAQWKGYPFITSAPAPEQIEWAGLQEAIEQMRKNLEQPSSMQSSGVYPAVLSGYVMAKFFITAWKLWDARSYVGGGGVLRERGGTQIASSLVTLRDIPVWLGHGYEAVLDSEGSDGLVVDLVKQGVQTGLLHTLQTAAALGAQTTGNAGRTAGLVKGYRTIVTPKNWVMEPGQNTEEELLAQLGEGLYIFDAFDEFHAINPASGDFNFPCNAVQIRRGKRQGLCRQLTISGNILQVLASVSAFGNRLYEMPLIMQDTYQVAAPAALISAIHVTGSV